MEPLCDFNNITVVRKGNPVLSNFTLKIQRGERLAILGPNGCGKSTLIKTILKELFPRIDDASSATVMGKKFWDVSELRKYLGVVSGELQRESWRDVSVEQMVVSGFFSSMGLFAHQQATQVMWDKAYELIDWLNISHLKNRMMNTLSTGQSRRVLIARALVHSPETVLLDEPGNGLDPAAQQKLRKCIHQIAEAGHGIILITHNLPDITSDIQRIVMIKQGQVMVDGKPRDVLTTENMTQLFDMPFKVTHGKFGYQIAAEEA